jgi:DNA topoisomerase-3
VSKTLIIAEKPSVGRDISRVLDDTFKPASTRSHLEGERYIITWAIGHLASPADPEKYDPAYKRWVMADLPIIPDKFKLTPSGPDAAKQLKEIKALMSRKDVTGVINACDAGREGELIFAYVYQLCRVKKNVQRLWLSSMTDAAIKDAFASLRPGTEFKRLEDAARSRSEADWIVGINATRAATVKTRGAFEGVVSLGRVQTPTLAMIVHREVEIRDFKPEPYWVVKGSFAAHGAEPGSSEGERAYSGMYLGGKRLDSLEAAQQVADDAHGKTGVVSKVETKESGEACDLLYDLTSLQRHANQRFGFSAERTLAAAQKLYEQHKALTYPRTSSRYLTSDMAAEIPEIAALLANQETYRSAASYVAGLEKLNLKRVVNDAKVADHHAIIPTKIDAEADYFEDDERKIYDLVVRRFLAIFHPDAVWAKTKVETTVEGHVFRTAGRVLVSAGWRAVYGKEGLEDKAGDEDAGDDRQQLPLLVEGEAAEAREVLAIEKATKPPKRYNEASLLGAMETAGKDIDDVELREAMKESGIGTPATRASIIERLLRVGYIRREGKQLRAEDKGIEVIELLDGHPITSAELTGSWEARLAHIEQATDQRTDFMRDIADFAREMTRQLGELSITVEGLGPCPSCGRAILETSKSYSCWTPDDPGCGFLIWKEKAGAAISQQAVRELLSDHVTSHEVKGFRSGGKKFDAHLKLTQADGRWAVQFADSAVEAEHGQAAQDAKRMIAPCPICKRGVFEGNKSYSCWTREDPGCGFTIWKSISGHDLTPDEARHLIQTKRSERPVVMQSRAGKTFAAYLVLKRRKADGAAIVRFDFDDVDQKAVIAEHEAEQERLKAEREAKRKSAKAKRAAKKADADEWAISF